jgi:hypothetical protein
VDEKHYWFEQVPEEQRYWIVAPWGKPPNREEKGDDLDLPGEFVAELKELEQAVRTENLFELKPDKAREVHAEARALKTRMDAVGYAPGLVSDEWWIDVVDRWIHDEGNEHVEAPPLFTTKGAAEKAASETNESAPEGYLDLVEQFGEAAAGEVFDNYVPRRALWVDRDTLLESLEQARFLCVMVDDRLRLREDFMQKLRDPGP